MESVNPLRRDFLLQSSILVSQEHFRGDFMEFAVVISVILNILVNVLLMLSSAKLCNFAIKKKKLLVAILLNALFGFGCFFIKKRALSYDLIWVSLLIFLAINTFGYHASSIQPAVIFISMSILYDIAISGLAVKKVWSLLLLGVCVLAVLFSNSHHRYKKYVPVEIKYKGIKNTFIALRDTGNLLKDPLTGKSVLIVSGGIAQQLTGLTAQQLQNPVDTIQLQLIPGLQLLSYSTIGQPQGLLLAMRFQEIKIGSRKASGLVAFAPDMFFNGCKYQALTGGTVLC